MAFLNEAFDVNELPQGTGGNFDPLPAGWYTVTITQAELKDTKAGNGQYIKLRYDVTGPTHQGRVVFGNLNIKNPNQKAEEIGRQQLGDIMRAIGLAKVTDTDQLIGNRQHLDLQVYMMLPMESTLLLNGLIMQQVNSMSTQLGLQVVLVLYLVLVVGQIM